MCHGFIKHMVIAIDLGGLREFRQVPIVSDGVFATQSFFNGQAVAARQ